MLRRAKRDLEAEKDFRFASVEKVFAPMMIFTACAMAFAHGSNDVANGIGPLAAIVSIVGSGGEILQESALPIWVLLVGGLGIVIGLVTMGYRVMLTVGEKITELTPTRGFCAELAAASTVVLASGTGLPVSTTHILVGAVMGVGLSRGVGALDLKMIGTNCNILDYHVARRWSCRRHPVFRLPGHLWVISPLASCSGCETQPDQLSIRKSKTLPKVRVVPR